VDKKVYDVKIIGCGLSVLYATSFLIFVKFLSIPGLQINTLFYIILFGVMLIGSLAVITLKEWGRKVIIIMNAVMFLCISARYIPKIDIIPLAYICMNVIVFLYFSQAKIKMQFHSRKFDTWHSILVVDDDESIIKLLRPILISSGYSVLTADTGEAGLQVAAAQHPDLIILDVILPGIKGREVCKKLKENDKTKDIPVVFLTAKDSPEDIQAEMDAGAEAHLTKPVNAKSLIETIQKILISKIAVKK
jgi:twitching motility two-component system response regulator PilH